MRWVKWFEEVGIEDVPLVGGKNASLGEMMRELGPLGVKVPPGFAVTAEAYRYFLQENGLVEKIQKLIAAWKEKGDVDTLIETSRRIRSLITAGRYPGDLAIEMMGPAEAQEALQAAREIRDAVITRLPPPNSKE